MLSFEEQKKLFEQELKKGIDFLEITSYIRLIDITHTIDYESRDYSFNTLIVYYRPDKSEVAVWELDSVVSQPNNISEMRIWLMKYLVAFSIECIV
jgi:hypothetical protein